MQAWLLMSQQMLEGPLIGVDVGNNSRYQLHHTLVLVVKNTLRLRPI